MLALVVLTFALLERTHPAPQAPSAEARQEFAYVEASTAFHEGDYPRAVAKLEQLERERPGDVRILLMLGDALIAMGRLDDARAVFERAVKLDPTRAQSWSRLGVLRADEGDVKGAREALARALAANPKDSDALEQTAELDAKEGKLDEAVAGLRAAAVSAIEQQRPALHSRAAQLLSENDRTADAVTLLRQAREQGIVSLQLLELLGELELRLGALEAAEKTFREAAIAAKRDPTLWFILGEILAKLGRADDAAQAFEQSLKLEKRAATHVALGRLALGRGDRRGAERQLEAAAEALSGTGDLDVLEISSLLVALDRPKDALAVLSSLADEEAQAGNTELQRRTAKLAKRVGDSAVLQRACERVQAAEPGPCP